ncbi:hypothetical protein ACWDYH_36325 [Nocardia goodfellowii]
MTTTVSVEGLYAALAKYGTLVGEFTPSKLARTEGAALALLRELGDETRLDDERYRLQLVDDVVRTTLLIVSRMPDPTVRRVIEAALALRQEFFGKPVGKRIASLDGISEDVYKDRRRQGLHSVAFALAKQFHGRAIGFARVCIAGSYGDRGLDAFAEEFGARLAEFERPIVAVSGYAAPGRRISEAMVAALVDKGVAVDSRRVVEYAREVKDRVSLQGPGSLIRHGKTQEPKRYAMLQGCVAVVLFAGSHGTAEEARMAENLHIPVIPLPWTGGTARQYWLDRLATMESIGGRQGFLYKQLGDSDRSIAMQAALDLLERAIGLAPH